MSESIKKHVDSSPYLSAKMASLLEVVNVTANKSFGESLTESEALQMDSFVMAVFGKEELDESAFNWDLENHPKYALQMRNRQIAQGNLDARAEAVAEFYKGDEMGSGADQSPLRQLKLARKLNVVETLKTDPRPDMTHEQKLQLVLSLGPANPKQSLILARNLGLV